MKRITIKDIARELHIHHSTVSRALRRSKEINQETIERVVKYATENGYEINRSALHLRGTGNNIIGVVVPNIYHNFFSNFVSIITRLAFTSGYIVSVFQSEESYEQEKEIVKSIIQQNLAGVIASISMETTDVTHFQQLSRYKIPLVCFDRTHKTLDRPKVILDNELALKNSITKLQNKGYSRIAYLSGNPEIDLFNNRQKGYYLGLQQNNLQYRHCIAITDTFTIEKGFNTTRQLMESSHKPDAIIFDSHILTWGALKYLKSLENNLLNEICLASFGGNPLLTIAAPNTLSIQQPEEEMAQASFNLLVQAINAPDNNDNKSFILQATIID